jgi:hypothetical protein
LTGMKPCSRCGDLFRVSHGNQRLCGQCRVGRPVGLRRGLTRTFGVRQCELCGREFMALAENQRFCSPRHRWLSRRRVDRALYANPEHRGARARLLPVVASGVVRCARGAACRRAELVDGELVGGLISPTEQWHLGHPDGESRGGPEHVACNTGAPQRLRAARRSGEDFPTCLVRRREW